MQATRRHAPPARPRRSVVPGAPVIYTVMAGSPRHGRFFPSWPVLSGMAGRVPATRPQSVRPPRRLYNRRCVGGRDTPGHDGEREREGVRLSPGLNPDAYGASSRHGGFTAPVHLPTTARVLTVRLLNITIRQQYGWRRRPGFPVPNRPLYSRQPTEGADIMRSSAAVFRKVHEPLTIETVDIDKPRGREVLVRTAATGVCHSDLHVIDGLSRYPTDLPFVLGHE